jgi:hypothetical protein
MEYHIDQPPVPRRYGIYGIQLLSPEYFDNIKGAVSSEIGAYFRPYKIKSVLFLWAHFFL